MVNKYLSGHGLSFKNSGLQSTYGCSQHLEKLQEFWSTLEDIDKSLWVVNSGPPSRAMSCRQINIGELLVYCIKLVVCYFTFICSLISFSFNSLRKWLLYYVVFKCQWSKIITRVRIHFKYLLVLLPLACVLRSVIILSYARCRFMGSDTTVNSLTKTWRRNSKRWYILWSLLRSLSPYFIVLSL